LVLGLDLLPTQQPYRLGHVQEELPHRPDYLAERRVAQAVEGLVAGLTGLDDVLVAEDGEVLGGVGLLDPHLLAQLADRQLALVEVLHDGAPGRVRQRLEDARRRLGCSGSP
jgi:hypothetical protein